MLPFSFVIRRGKCGKKYKGRDEKEKGEEIRIDRWSEKRGISKEKATQRKRLTDTGPKGLG